MATLDELVSDYQHFTNQAFRHLEKAGPLTPEQEVQAAQTKAMLALATSNIALATRNVEQ
jgi:hypothetical protein